MTGRQTNTKAKINVYQPDNWNDVWSESNLSFVTFHSVANAGTAPGSPKQCYAYGILITFTTSLSANHGWRNFQIFIEDPNNDSSGRGRIFVRSHNANYGTWKIFTGSDIESVH